VKEPRSIVLSDPFPLVDEGQYVALCTEATFAWAKQWKKWIARFVLVLQNYQGRPYVGRLCAFFGLGRNPERPYAGPQSRFRRLYVEVNGDQPTAAEVGMEPFVGILYDIKVQTVKTDRNGKLRASEHWYSVVREIRPHKADSVSTQTRKPSKPIPFNSSTLRTQATLATDQHSNTANTPLGKRAARTSTRPQGFG
jgi:hypothetical protein